MATEPIVGQICIILITTSFVVGICGNITALWILCKSKCSKHVLMLRCLAMNDLVAEVGMLILLYLDGYIPKHTFCALFVCLRAFGLGSGCVALVMAMERWLALTRPFQYQQMVTNQVIKSTIFSLWSLGALITCLPLFGFGLYYNGTNAKCPRYRDATEVVDIIYAYVFFIFGTSLCILIVFFNTSVFCTLAGTKKKKKKVLVRRVSRSIINRIDIKQPVTTNEELAFAKLMAILCVIFVLCWLPQMIAIPLAQVAPNSAIYKGISLRFTDILMSVYFTLDPYVYVHHQYLEKGKLNLPFRRKAAESADNQQSLTPNTTPTSNLLQPPNFIVLSAT